MSGSFPHASRHLLQLVALEHHQRPCPWLHRGLASEGKDFTFDLASKMELTHRILPEHQKIGMAQFHSKGRLSVTSGLIQASMWCNPPLALLKPNHRSKRMRSAKSFTSSRLASSKSCNILQHFALKHPRHFPKMNWNIIFQQVPEFRQKLNWHPAWVRCATESAGHCCRSRSPAIRNTTAPVVAGTSTRGDLPQQQWRCRPVDFGWRFIQF